MIDIFLAILIVCFWNILAPYLTEPLSWATARNLPPRPGLLETPTALVWLIPLLSGVGAWLALNLRLVQTAWLFAIFPLLYIGLVGGWFYLAPLAWH